MINISFTINGVQERRSIESSMLLLDLLRDELSLKGTKAGCHEGECGACTVLVDGKAVNSCLYLAANIDGREVITIEGLSSGDILDPVQAAMIHYGAIQCGYCTPGIVMTVKSFQHDCLARGITPDREQIKKALEGNLCRCTGYVNIVEAVESLFGEQR